MGGLQVCLFLTFLCGAQSANILGFLPMPFYSHTHSFLPIFTELAARGHNVTMVSPFPRPKQIPNYHDIVVPNVLKDIVAAGDDEFDPRKMNGWFTRNFHFWFMAPACVELVLNEKVVQDFIKDSSYKFDVVISETAFMQEPFVALAHKFNAPFININNLEPWTIVCEFTGQSCPWSYVPSFKITATDRMTFLERLSNTVTSIIEIIGSHAYYLPVMNNLMKKHFKYPGSDNLPHITDLLKNMSLTLVDAHFSIGFPRPYQRNVVEFGGLSLKNAGKLPPDFQKFMDDAKEGVVLFTLGSFFNTTKLRKDEIDGLIHGFGKLKLKVIMKWENETLPHGYTNIKFAKWLPQASILAHPNCKLFITHAGIHGVYEAAFNAMPVLGFPLFADQHKNMIIIESKGFGKTLKEMTTDQVYSSIMEIVSNKRYKEAALKMSALVQDRPIPPLDNAIFWIEYVLRHNGAPHLRPAVLDMPFYQYFLLDVFAVMAAILCLVAFQISVVVSVLYRVCCRRKKTTETKEADKKSKKKKSAKSD